MARDPSGMVDGPNLYAFVGNRPTYAFDPWGLETGTIYQEGQSYSYDLPDPTIVRQLNGYYQTYNSRVGFQPDDLIQKTYRVIGLSDPPVTYPGDMWAGGIRDASMELVDVATIVSGLRFGLKLTEAGIDGLKSLLLNPVKNPFARNLGTQTAAKSGTTLADELAAAATRARNTVGPGSGGAYGTRVHSAFDTEVQALGRGDVKTEVSYLNGVEVTRGTAGSVRLDVVEFGPNGQILNVYDLKTGSAVLTPQRIQQIQLHIPGGANVPVLEVRP